MKIQLVALALTLVGSCSTLRHTKKIERLKENIAFENTQIVEQYLNTITEDELKAHVYAFSSEEFNGRKSGEPGHHKASRFLKDYYIAQHIKSPLGSKYYQHIPESYFSEDIKDSQNVIAFIEGSEYPNEVVIISAHSDHEGYTETDIYYGADDNGSGTAAVLEMAQAFQKAADDGHRPKRSVVFLHLTGEEIGLTGSRYYTQYPVFSMSNTVANLNIDMIGRVDDAHADDENYIYVIGADRLSTELHYISEEANSKFTNLNLDYKLNSDSDPNRYYYRSDHYNFAQKGVPVIFYFNGEHEDYHETTDTPDKINYPLLKKRTNLIFATAWYLANSEQRIIVDKLNL
ncbi:M28 family metallopeptidase [Psychroserpens algicola]|uniref:M28 family metallopeptidase n=1 Tax=Psychroserpens algicola TaxID=1719034 RepID=A0ABT0H5P5_9FLAO|nr:M28 family metallopeptidase [Psychroserpens algicola]MCK8479688.1 M28 family metallopeptidase [Psychroserpens algicola]